MTHTFQVGDRVIVGDATKGDYSVPRCGESGVLKMVYEFGYEVALDKPELNRSEGIWYVSYGDLRHDTNFQVGDWVRYEGITEFALKEVEGRKGQVMDVNTDSIYVDFPNYEFKGAHWCRENLVKIQPPVIFNDCYVHEPQEEPMQERQEDAIERGIQEKIQLLERQVEKAKCCLETYRDLKRFINQEDHHGTR